MTEECIPSAFRVHNWISWTFAHISLMRIWINNLVLIILGVYLTVLCSEYGISSLRPIQVFPIILWIAQCKMRIWARNKVLRAVYELEFSIFDSLYKKVWSATSGVRNRERRRRRAQFCRPWCSWDWRCNWRCKKRPCFHKNYYIHQIFQIMRKSGTL